MKSKTPFCIYAEKSERKSPLIADCARAFLSGGLICTFAQGLTECYTILSLPEESVKLLVPVTLIFLAALLTGIGIYDNIVKFAGAGALVPITGFSNAVTAPAIDSKTEGYILGVGANMFKIAGPVIAYGTLSSVIYGVIYWISTLF